MEERSPGSYRLNIRGSSLRSPFGVRNVKIYYNNIPFTDPGGHTYLNQLGYYNFQTIEIIKGPGSSIYGSGTGGVMLINNNAALRPTGVNADYSFGSFGLHNINLNINFGSDANRNMLNYQHQQSDGYRMHSAMRRDIIAWEATTTISSKDKLNTSLFYGDLYYKTPGALTLAEYETNPRLARPTIGFVPGSEQAQAAIRQKTFLAGSNYQHAFNSHWLINTSAYGALTRLDNPTIRNYGRSNEPHVGGRSILTFDKQGKSTNFQWQIGGELQKEFATVRISDNRNGRPDTLRSDDEINSLTYFAFTQFTAEINKWIITGGVSYNRQNLRIIHLAPLPYNQNNIRFNNKLAPRVALLYKINKGLSVYSSLSRGFSPPTTAELYPTGSISNPDLHAEEGWNYDVGLRGNIFSPRLFMDVNAFYFRLRNTIVQRRDALGGDYFANAGSTRQKGIESQLWYQLFQSNQTFSSGRLLMNYTYYHFRYRDFKQLTTDFSGNRLPGASPQTFTAALDIAMKVGLYTNITYQYVDPIPLNDANNAYAESYNLLMARVGYKHGFNKFSIDVFAGGDNLFNVRYSLGNDINGFGGRYYNAAAGRNYFAGISCGLFQKYE